MKKFLTILAIALAIVSCKKDGAATSLSTNLVLPANAGSIINASNRTAFDLFSRVVSLEANKNILISPLSIYMALSMVYNGADNATRDSIAKVLQLEGIDIRTLNATAKAMMEQLPREDTEVKMAIGNSIWYRNDGMQPLQSFLDITKENYQAAISALDFKDPSALSTINNWVSEKTNGKIPTILDQLDGNDLMYLINAIYFNGSWKYAFNPSDSYNSIFLTADGRSVSTPFMNQETTVLSVSNENFEMVELPYGTGNSFSMYILLPKKSNTLINQFAATLNESTIQDAIMKMDSSKMTVTIPKWQYAYTLEDLKNQLTAMGMGIAFTDGADFSKLYPGKTNITKAVHKTYIRVSEEGTEASAATAIGIGYLSIEQVPVFIANHPFIYIIAEKQTGTILFTGIVNDPSQN
jgi:serine protease inhibitor